MATQIPNYRPVSLASVFSFCSLTHTHAEHLSSTKHLHRVVPLNRILNQFPYIFILFSFCTMLQVGAWYGLDQQQIIGLHRSLGLSSYFKAGCACYGRVLAGMIWRWNRQILLRLPMHLPLISLMSLKHLKKCFNNAF
ncbi:uncharacterized protein [Spinacia oleracea]|uniref:Uncharacterized protein isoform X1 n=1 Tax=Spinacia oleracea TaxID=3562 RepID=A0ABM3RVM8_SPIOL|nr:uncharacterized protein LOC130472508 isoform X1 [Spinacia oleracea]